MKRYRVDGMTCGGCVRSVERVVRALDEGLVVEVQLEPGEVRVDGPHTPEAVKQAVEKAGFGFGGEIAAPA
ncbi:MAG: heavy metal-associated domain-containing protein [Myxococcota bacterium]